MEGISPEPHASLEGTFATLEGSCLGPCPHPPENPRQGWALSLVPRVVCP